jgi:hypothetical protein
MAHGDSDLPTRRHAEVSRPANVQGRAMSSINSITSEKLARLIGTPKCPALIDVRADDDFVSDTRLIPGAVRRPSASVDEWAAEFREQSAVVICPKGLALVVARGRIVGRSA